MSNAIQKVEPQPNVVQINDNAALMQAVARAASDPNVDVEKMERLFAMHERMEVRQAEAAFNAAMSHVQANMRRTAADRHNKQTGSDYATYAALDRDLRQLYTAEGLSLSFDTEAAGDGVVGMICHVSHIGGHTRTYRASVPSDGKGAKGGDVMTKTHAFGSGTSYGMRYLLKMIFNVAIGNDPDDDDGNGAAEIQRITAEQAATINDMLEATASDKPKFLHWLKVDSVSMIPAQAYGHALSALKQKEAGK